MMQTLFLAACLIGVSSYGFSVYKLYLLISSAVYQRKFGNVYLLYSDQLKIPCSFSMIKKSYVVIPVELVEVSVIHILTIKHEIQHIRQRDGLWLHLLELVGVFCWWNPVYALLKRWFRNMRERSCDEAVLRKNEFKQYAAILLQVLEIQRKSNQKEHRWMHQSLLQRIQYMYYKKFSERWAWFRFAVISVFAILFGFWTVNATAEVFMKNYQNNILESH